MIKSLIVVYLVLSAVIGIATQIVLAYLYVAIWGFDMMNATVREMKDDLPECEKCGDPAECFGSPCARHGKPPLLRRLLPPV